MQLLARGSFNRMYSISLSAVLLALVGVLMLAQESEATPPKTNIQLYIDSSKHAEISGDLTQASKMAMSARQYQRAEDLIIKSIKYAYDKGVTSDAVYQLEILLSIATINDHYFLCEENTKKMIELGVVKKRTPDIGLYRILIDSLVEQGKLADALKYADRYIRTAKLAKNTEEEPTQGLCERAIILRRMGQNSETDAAAGNLILKNRNYQLAASRRYKRLTEAVPYTQITQAEAFLKVAGQEAAMFPDCQLSIAAPLNTLGELYYQQKRYLNAERAWLKALDATFMTTTDPQTKFGAGNSLQRLFDEQKEYEKTAALCRELLDQPDAIYESVPGRKNRLSLALAEALTNSGQMTAACAKINTELDALAAKPVINGTENNIFSQVIKISRNLRITKQFELAEALFEKVKLVKTQRKIVDTGYEIEIEDELANVYMAQLKYLEAKEILFSTLAPLAPLTIPKTEAHTKEALYVHARFSSFQYFAHRLDKLVECLKNLKDTKTATHLYLQHIVYVENIVPKNSWVLAQRLNVVGNYFFAVGDEKEAEAHFRRAAQIAENLIQTDNRFSNFYFIDPMHTFDALSILQTQAKSLESFNQPENLKIINAKIKRLTALSHLKNKPVLLKFSDAHVPIYCGNDLNINSQWKAVLDFEQKRLKEIVTEADNRGLL